MQRHFTAFGAALAGLLCLGSAATSWASEEEDRFRLGLMVGAPVGLTAAFDFGPRVAVHTSLSPPSDHTELGLRLDLVYRMPELGGEIAEVARVLFWFGAGLRWTFDEDWLSQVGVRVPFGVSLFVFEGGGEIYAEIAPALVLHPEREALVEAGLGLRFGLF